MAANKNLSRMSDWAMLGYVLIATEDIFSLPVLIYISVVPVAAALYFLFGFLREIRTLSALEIWKSIWRIIFVVTEVVMFVLLLQKNRLWPFD